MPIDKISISWFRGAADSTCLATGRKSIVGYGPNGSGKSCFVDALEYLLTGGKIEHLSHEYSGSRLERAIINTHMPSTARCYVEIDLGHATVRVTAHRLGQE